MAGSNGYDAINPSSVAGTKRKRESKPSVRFYAVRVGKNPGIYNSWPDCLEQVKGYPKAIFKSFPTHTEAQSFVNSNSAEGGSTSKVTTSKWYGVQNGRNPGVYTTWEDVLEQIKGWKGPKHKVFKTRAEAESFVSEGKTGGTDGAVDSIECDGPQAKKLKAKAGKKGNVTPGLGEETGEYEPGEGPLLSDAEDGFDNTIILDQTTGNARYKAAKEQAKMRPAVARHTENSVIKIYTDGSALGNGQNGATAGVGVFFGPSDKRNLKEALHGTRQTNNRAELTAILRALELAPKNRKLEIITDSNYSIKCLTEWFPKWRANNWVGSNKKPVENKDIIQKILDMLEERYKMNQHRVDAEDGQESGGQWEKGRASVKFTWVKGHDKDAGNIAADQLAVAGAREARELMLGQG